ncbi:DUF11 domain-containing protein [Acinetobacter sp. WCHA39]|uniref:prealbumin-like fold domain-containing protein n=1 Tax=Acinetobacter sp. WCHA39 TaxID=2004648 RepID=UPI000B3C65D8|nr:DUF11 domain-containing protein [Acinetobacter sp. WCHA39]
MVGMKVLQIFDLLKLQCTYSTKITIAILLCIFNISVANAAYQRGYLNLGFETPTIATGSNVCRVYISSTRVPGWLTTHPYGNEAFSGTCSISTNGSGQLMEMWAGSRNIDGTNTTPTNTIKAREGNQFVELNADAVSTVSQNICLVNGESVSWKFSHNGRNTADDTMLLRAGTQTITTVSTSKTGDGQVTSCVSGTCSVSSGSGSGVGATTGSTIKRWADYSGTFTYTGATGQVPMGFQSTSGTSTSGNFLDAIQIIVKPIIEFSSANYVVPENGGTVQPLKVIVVGDVPSGGISLVFNVNDGTAQLGVDYKINGGVANTFTKTIPQGNYGAGTPYVLEVPVEIINDLVNEVDDTFNVTINQSNDFHIMSSNDCGASGNGVANYVIKDDDLPTDMDLKVEKKQRIGTSGSFVADSLTMNLGDTIQYQLVISNKGENAVSDTSRANFTDAIPSNFNTLSLLSATKSNGAITCNASFTGNTLTGQFSGPKGATCTLVVQAKANSAGIVTNTATVNVPAANTEIFPSDNNSSVQVAIAKALITLTKSTIGGLGTFGFTLTGTSQTSGSITTLTQGEEYQVDGDTTLTGVQPFVVTGTGSITINESSLPTGGGWTLTGASCRNTAGNSVGSRSGSVYTLTAADISNNPNLNCNFVNTKLPTVKIQKISQGGTGTFDFANTNLSSNSSNVATSLQGSPNIGTGTSPVLTVLNNATDVVIRESSIATGYALKSASCVDSNSLITGNIGTFGNFSTDRITIPYTYLITGGADITCTFINSKPSLIIKKISRGGLGKFDFTGNNGIANHSITTTAQDTETVGETQYFTTPNPSTDAVINETNIPTGFRLTNAVCTGLPASSVTTNYTNATVTLNKSGIVSGAEIVCTLTNTLTTLTLIKKWDNAVAGDSVIVNSIGLDTNATTAVSVADQTGANSTTGTPVVLMPNMIGKTATILESFSKGDAADYNSSLLCTGNNIALNGFKLTIHNDDAAIICTLTNSRKKLVLITGRIFNDNGGTTNNILSNAYNAVQDANEIGIAGSRLKLANCAGLELNFVTISNSNGEYSFKVEDSVLTNPFCIVQTNLSEYSSVSGASPTGSYNRSTDTISLPKTTATSYPNNNFGDANLNIVLTEDGQHTIASGEVTDYPHRLNSQAPVQITQFNQLSTQQPNSANNQVWQALVYKDTNCNGNVDTGETVFNPTVANPYTLQPNVDLCLVQRVHSPTNVMAGAQHVSTLEASYSVILANPTQTITGQSTQRQDVTLIGKAGLSLTKKVRTVASCPSTSADQNQFAVTNQANNVDHLEYEITYKNNSTKLLNNVKIKDSLPIATSFGSMSCNSTPNGNSCNINHVGDSLEWNLTGVLNPAATGTVRFCVNQ